MTSNETPAMMGPKIFVRLNKVCVPPIKRPCSLSETRNETSAVSDGMLMPVPSATMVTAGYNAQLAGASAMPAKPIAMHVKPNNVRLRSPKKVKKSRRFCVFGDSHDSL